MESAAVEAEKGAAAIKEQFLTSKENFYEFLESGWTGRKDDEANKEEPEQKRMKLDKDGDKQEKRKMRGQNKSRPHTKPQSYEDKRLCPSIIQERETKCVFGEKCRFIHDVSEYMSGKPEDLGHQCYLYNTFGKCHYGLTCRFAKAHISPDLKNVVNEDLHKRFTAKETVRNHLDKELQKRLRKKQVAFTGAEAYLKTIVRGKKPEKKSTDECSPEETHSCTPNTTTDAPEDQETQQEDDRNAPVKTTGPITDDDIIKLRPCEKKQVDFRDKLYLAPLTTCGNLPFRRICKRLGADITCGEMAMCTNLLQGQASEWALLKRHDTEDLFGVQLEGCFPDSMTRCAELLNQNIHVDFVDINSGCPIDLVYKKGGGCGLMTRSTKFEQIVRGMNSVLDVPLTVKIRTGVHQNSNTAHKLIPELKKWGVSMITLHGRSREQRYTKQADWEYINTCSNLAAPVPLFGNGDILSYEDAMKARETGVSGIMIARGALIKPWLFTEVKENRHWDISSSERLDILRDFTNNGLEHWGSDTQGVEKTRNFLLEWLSFLCRYIPVGLLERPPQKINERPPFYMGRDYLESLMASQHVGDWVKISEMLLGPVPKNFSFLPKHKANAYK
ncbi:tRNA-dihydrouridine(47) synthase [NAD(P)(+)]-like [Triplophysa rosa]|uniref:tRNA-dihydrouridine(47) synthase [NAD(P)(+)] n=1 Tax=Triplophysa rosa TaxID=992332 RepID=A0A9W7TJV0_TRIRA|nr:tRNA-dihydrouridine(47) synthase [NAD(P)(+)]-like [Triplophysa rosa]KAI7798545.1 tRNA-dihydrouridine47 synthase [Triplophysa rosa]